VPVDRRSIIFLFFLSKDTQQWLLFATDAQDEQDESLQRRIFVIDALETDTQRRMRELKYDGLLSTNICFFGSNHFVLTRAENGDEENILFECRKMHSIF